MDNTYYHEAFSQAFDRHGSGPVMMYVCADSTLTYAPFGSHTAKIIGVAMPVGRVADTEQAEAIIAMIGQRPYDFADGDASYVKRAEKVAAREGGPAKRMHYSLPDFQFNNHQTVCNVAMTVCDVRDAFDMEPGDERQLAMHNAFEAARSRKGRFFTEQAAAEHQKLKDDAIDKWRAERGMTA